MHPQRYQNYRTFSVMAGYTFNHLLLCQSIKMCLYMNPFQATKKKKTFAGEDLQSCTFLIYPVLFTPLTTVLDCRQKLLLHSFEEEHPFVGWAAQLSSAFTRQVRPTFPNSSLCCWLAHFTWAQFGVLNMNLRNSSWSNLDQKLS